MDDAPFPIHILDRDWRFQYINRASMELTGDTARQSLGQIYWDVYPDTIGTPLWDLYHRAMDHGEIVRFEEYSEKLGRWFDVQIYPVEGGVAASFTDVTARKRVELELAESRRQLEQAQEIAGIGSYVWDIRTDLVTLSPELYRIAGLSEDYVPSLARLFEVVHPDDVPRAQDALQDALAGIAPYLLELRIVHPTEGPRIVTTRAEVLRDAEGTAIRLLGTLQDVTERRRTEEALRRSQERLVAAQQLAMMGDWDLDLITGGLSWSDEIYRICEIDKARFGASYEAFLQLVHPDDREAVDLAYTTAVAMRQPYETVHRLVMPDGRTKHVQERGQTFYADDGTPTRSVGTVQDITERWGLAEQIAEREETIRGVLDASSDIVLLVDTSGMVLLANEAAERRLAPDGQSLVGLSIFAALPPDVAARRRAWADEVVRTRRPVRNVDDRDGRTFDTRVYPLLDRGGAVTRVAIFARDITEQVAAERALRQSEEDFRVLFEQLPVAVTVLDLGTLERVSFNGQAASSLGYTREEFGRLSGRDIVPPEDAGALAEVVGHFQRQDHGEFQSRRVTRSGEVREFLVSGTAFERDGRRLLQSVSRDVTEARRAEHALRESQERLRAVLNNAPITIFALDADGVFTLSEGKGLERVGLKPGDNVGASALALYAALEIGQPDGSTINGLDAVQRVLAGGTVSGVTRLADDYFDNQMVPYRNEEGTVVGLIGVATVITERRTAEEALSRLNIELEERVRQRTAQLTAANRELETFTYSVSHDLKAPLRSIDGYSHLLLDDYLDRLDDDGRGFLQAIRRAAAQMGLLIDDLLAYSRLERQALHAGSVDVRELVAGLISSRSADLHARTIALTESIACPPLTVDREALTLVMRNLFENALKFLGDGADRAIEIGGRDEGSTVLLWVRDNGIGFDMKFHDRIFEIFQRLNRSEEYEGTGIGLAMVRKAVDRMGGRVWAESEPGSGSTFFVELPK